MGKGTTVATFLGYIGSSLFGSPSALAQQPNEPVRFGSNRDVTYELSATSGSETNCPYDPSSPKTNWGKLFKSSKGYLRLCGMLDGVAFVYEEGNGGNLLTGDKQLTLVSDNLVLRIIDSPSSGYKTDIASTGNLRDYEVILREEPNFFEGAGAQEPKDTLKGRLYAIFEQYKQWLNVRQAGAVQPIVPEQKSTEELNNQLERLLKQPK